MQSQFQLVGHETLSFPRYRKDERRLIAMEFVDSYKFIPRSDRVAAEPGGLGAARRR